MSLDFDSSGGDQYVDFSNASSINDWAMFTLCGWFNPDDNGINLARLFSKGAAKDLRFQDFGGPIMALTAKVNRATVDAISESVDNTVELDVWQFFCMAYDGTNGIQLFKGTRATPVAEVSYRTTPTVGSGTPDADAADPLYIGCDLVGGAARGFRGRIACVAYINKRLTLAELAPLQFQSMNMVVPGGETKLFSELGFNGIGTQPDLSDNGNNGTVTGAIVADHVPITIVPPRPLIIPSARIISPFPCFLPA